MRGPRQYSFVVTSLLVAGIGVNLLVLADLGNAAWLRLGLVGVSLVALFVRISADVVAATRR